MARLRPVVLACLWLAGCGFHPLYQDSSIESGKGSEESELQTVRVDTIADRQGQKLRNYLIDDLQGEGVPPPPKYELVVIYTENQIDLGLNNDATTTRGQLTLAASFTLKDIKTGVVQLTNSAQQITGYNIQNSEFATILSRDDAEDRALRAVADNIQLRLAIYFQNSARPQTKTPGTDNAVPPVGIVTPQQAVTGGIATPFDTHAPGQVLDNSSPITQTPDTPVAVP